MTKTIITDNQVYEFGSFTADIAPYNANGLIEGVGYTESMTFDGSLFPNGVNMNWDWPVNSSARVHSFLSLAYGNYDGGIQQTPILSSRLSDLTTLMASSAFSLSGNLTGFNVIYDLFLTPVAGGGGAHGDEVEVFLHAPAAAQKWIATLKSLGTMLVSNITWNVSVGPNSQGIPDYIFSRASGQDLSSGAVDIKTMLTDLVSKGLVSGSLYFNGLAMGVETTSGSGAMNLNSMSVNYATAAAKPTLTMGLKDITGSTVAGAQYTYDDALSGLANANAKVTIDDGATLIANVTANAQGVWTCDPNLANGYHDLVAYETNAYGNSASTSLVMMLNATPITVSEMIAYVAGQGHNGVYTIDPLLTGWTAPNDTVGLYDGAVSLGSVTANSSGFWSEQTSNLSIGNHDIIASVHDIYGRTASASQSFSFV